MNALRNSNLVKSLDEILEVFGLNETLINAETTILVKLTARILATVMNHSEAKF